jgi:hypothetical protein
LLNYYNTVKEDGKKTSSPLLFQSLPHYPTPQIHSIKMKAWCRGPSDFSSNWAGSGCQCLDQNVFNIILKYVWKKKLGKYMTLSVLRYIACQLKCPERNEKTLHYVFIAL